MIFEQVTHLVHDANLFRCKAAVTSPKFWAATGCFSIADYTLTTDNARGWETAERTCFEAINQGNDITSRLIIHQ